MANKAFPNNGAAFSNGKTIADVRNDAMSALGQNVGTPSPAISSPSTDDAGTANLQQAIGSHLPMDDE